MLRRKVIKQGNSRALTIPPVVMEMLGWDGDQEVEMSVSDNENLLVVPVREKEVPNLLGDDA